MLFAHILAIVAVSLVFTIGTQAKWAAQIERREAIKDAFQYNYAKYEELAYPKDLLKPISKSGLNNDVLAG